MEKLLIIRTDHIGDLILTTPLIRSLARSKKYYVDVVARRLTAQLLENNQYITNYFSIEDVEPDFPGKWKNLLKWLHLQKYDVLILPCAKPKELLFASFLSGIRKRVVLTGGIWGRITAHRCLRSRLLSEPRHMTDVLLDFARYLEVHTDGTVPDIFLTENEMQWGNQQMHERFGEKAIVGIHPGSLGNACNLPAPVYGEIAQLILEKTDWGIVVTGNAAEKSLVENWPKNIFQTTRCWLTHGLFTLRQLSAIIKEMTILICPPTGPLHIAAGTGTITLSPFCPVPYRGQKVWGNCGIQGLFIEGNIDFCKIDKNGRGHNCDFHGQITAQRIFNELMGLGIK